MRKIVVLGFLLVSSTSFALANPASTKCLQDGYRYLLVNNVGICLFPDHSYCEEWSYFRGQCRPGQNKPVSDGSVNNNGIGSPNPQGANQSN